MVNANARKETNRLNHSTLRPRRTWRNLAAQGERKMSMILRSSPGVVAGLANASRIDSKLLAWTLFAVVIVAIAIYALAVSPQPDADSLATIAFPP